MGNYLDAARYVLSRIEKDDERGEFGAFPKVLDDLFTLHARCGREDALLWGAFCTSDVRIAGSDWCPPEDEALPGLARRGFVFLTERPDARERAVAAYLFMACSQFFFDRKPARVPSTSVEG